MSVPMPRNETALKLDDAQPGLRETSISEGDKGRHRVDIEGYGSPMDTESPEGGASHFQSSSGTTFNSVTLNHLVSTSNVSLCGPSLVIPAVVLVQLYTNSTFLGEKDTESEANGKGAICWRWVRVLVLEKEKTEGVEEDFLMETKASIRVNFLGYA
ncbi:unnamed protein product [Cyclocybe aegerita]|uniref:Uncharacterized protein n=1 Tax=Cyclocybe aegerita TaxID=1973307 RepID=A0A8S0VVN2_CYCAE|nr:unnamed protein product [Cyclocybe aegerita]